MFVEVVTFFKEITALLQTESPKSALRINPMEILGPLDICTCHTEPQTKSEWQNRCTINAAGLKYDSCQLMIEASIECTHETIVFEEQARKVRLAHTRKRFRYR